MENDKTFTKRVIFSDIFNKYNSLNLNAIKQNAFISYLTRFWAEVILILGVILFYVTLKTFGETEKEILIKISILFVLSLRLFPSINRITGYIQKIKFLAKSVKKIIEDIEQFKRNKYIELEAKKNIKIKFEFDSILNITNLNFGYHKREKNIIENLNLKILNTEIIGIFGKTGSGNPLVDLISDLLPKSGKLVLGKNDISEDIVL